MNNITQSNTAVNNVNQNEEMYRQDAVKPKGAYMQNLDRNGVIYLFEKSDASTFMHETAHFFFKELQKFGTERSKAMLRKVNEWADSEFEQRFKTKAEGGGIVVVDKLGNIVYVITTIGPNANHGTAGFIPIVKDGNISLSWENYSISFFRFYYAQGEI